MKILVQQFARLGDIYLTWPVLNALQRSHPEAEIHILVREKYSDACVGLDPKIQVHKLPSRDILEPVYSESNDWQLSLAKFSGFIDRLVEQKFDQVINLSFSPMSSYIAHIFEVNGSKVRGYSRHSDGFFNMPDDGSAYFYAQVGIGRSNRYHLVDLFAFIAGVELINIDFRDSEDEGGIDLPAQEYLCVHVGGSEGHKAFPAKLLRHIVQYFCEQQGLNVVLIGSSEDQEIVTQAVGKMFDDQLINLVGKTTVPEAFQVISRSYLTIGPDSFAMHVASLTGTPCLNLSCESVNFWETGPLSQHSRVLWQKQMQDHDISDVIMAFEETMLSKDSGRWTTVAKWEPGQPRYKEADGMSPSFGWTLIQALYSGAPFPTLDDFKTYKVIENLHKMSEVAMDALPDVLNPATRRRAFELLSQIDRSIDNLETRAGELSPLLRWFRTEKIRLGPQLVEELVAKTGQAFIGLHGVCSYYVMPEKQSSREIEGEI